MTAERTPHFRRVARERPAVAETKTAPHRAARCGGDERGSDSRQSGGGGGGVQSDSHPSPPRKLPASHASPAPASGFRPQVSTQSFPAASGVNAYQTVEPP